MQQQHLQEQELELEQEQQQQQQQQDPKKKKRRALQSLLTAATFKNSTTLSRTRKNIME